MMRAIVFLVLSGAAMASVGCQKSPPEEKREPAPTVLNHATTPEPAPAPTEEPTTPPTAGHPDQQQVEIEIASVGDTMAFDKKTLTVPAGSRVHLVLKNHGTMPVMTHNWVLVKKGSEERVAAEGLEKAAKTGYVVPSEDVIAYTPMALPGKTSEVTFDAPPPGTYAYICTFPGHYVVMKGELTVTP